MEIETVTPASEQRPCLDLIACSPRPQSQLFSLAFSPSPRGAHPHQPWQSQRSPCLATGHLTSSLGLPPRLALDIHSSSLELQRSCVPFSSQMAAACLSGSHLDPPWVLVACDQVLSRCGVEGPSPRLPRPPPCTPAPATSAPCWALFLHADLGLCEERLSLLPQIPCRKPDPNLCPDTECRRCI